MQRLLDVPLGRLLRSHREVAHDHIGLGLLEDADHIGGLARSLLHDVGKVLADAVVGHAAADLDPKPWDVAELHCVVGPREDRVRQIEADFLLVDIERCHELDVADVIAAQVDVHEPGDEVVLLGVLVVRPALDEAARAIADADDGDPDLAVLAARAGPGAGAAAVAAVGVVAVVGHVFFSVLPISGWVGELEGSSTPR